MLKRLYLLFVVVITLAIVALPAAAAESGSINLPEWIAWLMVVLALFLPLVVIANLQRRS